MPLSLLSMALQARSTLLPELFDAHTLEWDDSTQTLTQPPSLPPLLSENLKNCTARAQATLGHVPCLHLSDRLPTRSATTNFTADGGWAEVIRFSSGDATGGARWSVEGFNGNITVGCWFWPVPGSGIFVNVGRSLRAASRGALVAMLGPMQTLMKKSTVMGAVKASSSSGDFEPEIPGDFADDRVWCLRALELGYDSFQIAAGGLWMLPELVVCSGGCASTPVAGPCPPLPLRQSAADGAVCECADGLGVELNCGAVATARNKAIAWAATCNDARVWTVYGRALGYFNAACEAQAYGPAGCTAAPAFPRFNDGSFDIPCMLE